MPEAARHFEKALSLMETDVSSPNMLMTCYTALGDREALRRTAQVTLDRALLIDPDNANMRYNFACTLACHLKDQDSAVEVLEPLFERISTACAAIRDSSR